MRVLAVIPARWGASRFPGKPLARIAGRPMLWWVVQGVRRCALVQRLLIATDDPRIEQAAAEWGAEVILTPSDLPSGTDRVWHAVRDISADWVLNVQGDEPTIGPDILEPLIQEGLSRKAPIATPVAPVRSRRELLSPDVVKVVTDARGFALYFSRAPIPFSRDGTPPLSRYLRHIGVYLFQRETLERWVRLSPSPLEQIEKLEQLRALEAGIPILTVRVPRPTVPVDRPEDIPRAEAVLKRLSWTGIG